MRSEQSGRKLRVHEPCPCPRRNVRLYQSSSSSFLPRRSSHPFSTRCRPCFSRKSSPASPCSSSCSSGRRSEEHTSELQSRENLVCRLLLEKKKNTELHLAFLNTH